LQYKKDCGCKKQKKDCGCGESSSVPYGIHYTHQHKHFHLLCQTHMGRNVEIEMQDGKVYTGKMHSFDNDNMYLAMQGETERDSRIVFVGPWIYPGFGVFGFPFWGVRRFRPLWW
jgi:small nuclear ribonucleoprotein (snRNP)-like protein